VSVLYIFGLHKTEDRMVGKELISWGGVRLSPLCTTSATNWPIVPAPDEDDDDDECGAVGGMRIGRGNRITWRKTVPVPHCPSQIPHDLTWARTQAVAVGIW
jgi:hypothetical protein